MINYFSFFDDLDDDIEKVLSLKEEKEIDSIFAKYLNLFESKKTREDFIIQYGYYKTICVLAFLSEIKELYCDGNDSVISKRYKLLNVLRGIKYLKILNFY